MGRQILAITIKDLKILFRDRPGMILLFAMPIMFILIMSSALQGVFEAGSAENPVELLVVNLDEGATYLNGNEIALGDEVIAAMATFDGLKIISEVEGEPLTRERAESLIADGAYPMALVFPTGFSRQVLQAVEGNTVPEVDLILDPGASTQLVAPVRAAIAATLNRTAAYAQAPYHLRAALEKATSELTSEQQHMLEATQALIADQITTYSMNEIGNENEIRIIDTTPSLFKVEKLPSSVEQNVPGYAIFGVFFIVGVLASSILNEKESGTFRRLQVAPLSNTALLLGKLLPYYLVNLIQVALMFALGKVIFGMNLGDLRALGVVTLATAAAATGLGLLVAALGKTRSQVSGSSILLAVTLAAIGGMMVPVYVMPKFMQTVAKISPHYWALRGYQDVIVRGLGMSAVLDEAGVLLAFAVAFYVIAVWKFRFE